MHEDATPGGEISLATEGVRLMLQGYTFDTL